MSLPVGDAVCYVGIDWAAASHSVCVLDPDGERRAEFTVEHSAAGFADLVRRLGRFGEAGDVPVAIVIPDS